jgi:hypothetical protein
LQKDRKILANTLQDKYGLSSKEDIEAVLSEIEETGTYTGDLGFNQTMGKTTLVNLIRIYSIRSI